MYIYIFFLNIFVRSLSERSSIDDESDHLSDSERRMSVLSVNRPSLKRSHSKSVERSVSVERSISVEQSAKNEDGKLTNIETVETGKVSNPLHLVKKNF